MFFKNYYINICVRLELIHDTWLSELTWLAMFSVGWFGNSLDGEPWPNSGMGGVDCPC